MTRKTLSQNLWLQRKKTDRFFTNAKREGFRARSAYKLIEINNKFSILKTNLRVVDLGAAPGSWSQVVSRTIFKGEIKKSIFAIDINKIAPIKGVITIQENINDMLIKNSYFNNNSLNLVLSDMAPKSTGHKFTDQVNADNLSNIALEFAKNYLKENGNFVCKLLGGNFNKNLILQSKKFFKTVKYFKPAASRKNSKEIYLICLRFNNLQ